MLTPHRLSPSRRKARLAPAIALWALILALTVPAAVADIVRCEPQSSLDGYHPATYWYDVTPEQETLCDFHVRVYDSTPANYTGVIKPSNWFHQLHQVNNPNTGLAEWWFSFWDPIAGCPNGALAGTSARFGFFNSNVSTWGDWTTTQTGTNDPFLFPTDASHHAPHPLEPNGGGFRVHVPFDADFTDTVVCEPQGGNNGTHPPNYWYDVTPGGFGLCDFHVRVHDATATNYSSVFVPTGWAWSVHTLGGETWFSWWDNAPLGDCPNAIFGPSPTRFKFSHQGPRGWSDWTTTISNSDDPYSSVKDFSGNHTNDSDGSGYRVHAPAAAPPSAPPALWNRLDDTSAIEDSEIGVDGTTTLPLDFGPVRHGDGVALGSGVSQVRFDGPFGTEFPDAGTLDFWWIPAHEENSSTGSHFAERFPFVLASDEQRPGNWPALHLYLTYRSHGFASDLTWVSFGLWDNDTGIEYAWGATYDLDFAAGQLMHVAISWDKFLGAAPIKVYFDGIEGTPVTEGSLNPEQLIERIQDKTQDSGFTYDLELLRYSRRPDGAQFQYDPGMYVDNLLLWDVAQTDFEYRLDENPNPVNLPPEIDCLGATLDNEPGECFAYAGCEDIATCFDPEGAGVTRTCLPEGPYPVGTHDVGVTCDDGENATTATCAVVVADVEPPTIAVVLEPSTLWPPNHRMIDVDAAVSALDNCDTPAVVLLSVESNESDNGAGDGNTVNDIQGAGIGTPDFRFELRAERAGGGDGRIYTATYEARDATDNTASASGFAVVPHDQGGGTEPLGIALIESGNGTVVSWSEAPGALAYDVIRGRLGDIADTGVVIDLGTVLCIENDSPDLSTGGMEDASVPDPGQGFLYLVEYDDGTSSSYGTESASLPRAPGPGDCD